MFYENGLHGHGNIGGVVCVMKPWIARTARTFKVVQSNPVSATPEPPGGVGSAVT